MIKATFTKLKRACVIALVPQIIVRGDGRSTTKKFCKTTVNVLRKAGKSTGSKDGESERDKCKRLIELVFGPSKSKANTHIFEGENKTAIDNVQEIHEPSIVQAKTKVDQKTNTEKQNSILKDFFGADEDVVRQDNHNKNLDLQAATINKHKTLNRDNFNCDNLNTNQSMDIPQTRKKRDYYDYNYDATCSSDTTNNFEKQFPANEYDHKQYDFHDEDVHRYIPATTCKLEATTAKENEEKSFKKIKVLGETPRAEDSSSKIEGFNIPPKVLTDEFKNIWNDTNTQYKLDFQGSLDKIAKKCMDTPPSQIDKKVRDEIKQMGNTGEKKMTTEENVVPTRTLQTPGKPFHEMKIDLDHRKDKREPINFCDENKMGPAFEMPPYLDQAKTSVESETENICNNKIQMKRESKAILEENKQIGTIQPDQSCSENEVDLYDPRPRYDINEPIIDPCGKKTLAFENYELEETVTDSNLLNNQRIGKPSEKQESKDKPFAETYIYTSEEICSQQESKMPVLAEDNKHLDNVKSVYDCAPREINWRPYPSFEAREEVMDFYSHHNGGLHPSKLNHAETKQLLPSEAHPIDQESFHPQHIYTSTTVASDSREKISHSFVQPEEMFNPLLDKNINEPKIGVVQPENIVRNFSESFEAPTSLNIDGAVSLTELLKRVRMRNRMEYCREFSIHTLNVSSSDTLPAQLKCPKKTPPCPPPPPKCPPPSPCPSRPPPCPPSPPPCPKPCKPASKPPCPPPQRSPCKFQKFDRNSVRDILTQLTQNNLQEKSPQKYFLPIIAYNVIHITGHRKSENKEIVNENRVYRLSILGKILLFHCTQNFDANLLRKKSELSFARDFKPWTPIPSWPMPKKEEKKRFVCPKEGCKVYPPPKLNLPCKENPCFNFPKRNNFSLTQLVLLSFLENLV